jgi:hypothetical protein
MALPGLIAYYYILRCFTSNWRSSSR